MQKHSDSCTSFRADDVLNLNTPALWPQTGSTECFYLPGGEFYSADSMDVDCLLSGWPLIDDAARDQNALPDLSQHTISEPSWPWTQATNPFVSDMGLQFSQSCFPQNRLPVIPICYHGQHALVDRRNDIGQDPSEHHDQHIESVLSNSTGSLESRTAYEERRDYYQLVSNPTTRHSTNALFSSSSPDHVDAPRDVGTMPKLAVPSTSVERSSLKHNPMRTKSNSAKQRSHVRTERSQKDTNRTAHNMIERRYRNNLNSKFAMLLSSLPQNLVRENVNCELNARYNKDEDNTRIGKIVSKRNVIELAIQYIKILESENGQLLGKRMDLTNALDRFGYAL